MVYPSDGDSGASANSSTHWEDSPPTQTIPRGSTNTARFGRSSTNMRTYSMSSMRADHATHFAPKCFVPEFVTVEPYFLGDCVVVPVLLNVEALVDVVVFAVLAVDSEAVEAIVGVLHINYAAVVGDVWIPLEDCAVGLTLNRDVRILSPGIFNMRRRETVRRVSVGETEHFL